MRWPLGPLSIVTAALLSACAPTLKDAPKDTTEIPPSSPKAGMELVEVSYSFLPGWSDDNQAAALAAFRISCATLVKKPATRKMGAAMGSGGTAGTIADWRGPCEASARIPNRDAAARKFFEYYFVPWLATNKGQPDGLFTGYYEAELHGAWKKTPRFRFPIYARPTDLVDIDLGRFRSNLKGQKLSGRLRGKRLIPYSDRAAIDKGALAGKGLELLYVDSATDAFFLHVQGSGRVRMSDGSVVRLGFAGRNGLAYTSIGRVMIDRGYVTKEQMSMKTIRTWVADHPRLGAQLMAENASYIFFSILKRTAGGPVGALGVPLTPGRSLAVDRRFVPLGVPVWLDTTNPVELGRPLRRLMVAQDTGGAIKGPVRGDFFWGYGKAAAAAAGAMSQRGRAYLLLPNGVKPQS